MYSPQQDYVCMNSKHAKTGEIVHIKLLIIACICGSLIANIHPGDQLQYENTQIHNVVWH